MGKVFTQTYCEQLEFQKPFLKFGDFHNASSKEFVKWKLHSVPQHSLNCTW